MYILTCMTPSKALLKNDLEKIRRFENIQILELIDDNFPSQLLIQGDSEAVRALMLLLPHWKAEEENKIPLPDTRYKAN